MSSDFVIIDPWASLDILGVGTRNEPTLRVPWVP
jgi:hypothetical protein